MIPLALLNLTPVFAQFDFDLAGPIFMVIRGIVAVGIALVAWFVLTPVYAVSYRLVARKAMPPTASFLLRSLSSLALGVLAFFFLPIGGSGGFGFGSGSGGGPGKGAGDGSGKNGNNDPAQVIDGKRDKIDGKTPDKEKQPANKNAPLEIEIIGGARYPGGGKFYLIERKEPPRTLEDIENYFDKNKIREVTIVLTPDSPGIGAGNRSPMGRLRYLLNQLKIDSLVRDELK